MPKSEGQRRRERERQKRRRRERAIALATAAGNDPNLEVQPVRRIRCHRVKPENNPRPYEEQYRILLAAVQGSPIPSVTPLQLPAITHQVGPSLDEAEIEVYTECLLQQPLNNNSRLLRPSAYGRWFHTNALYVPLEQVTDFPITSFIGKCLYVDLRAADRGVTLPENVCMLQYVRIVDVAAGHVTYRYYRNHRPASGYVFALQAMTHLYVCNQASRCIGLQPLLTKPFPLWPSHWDKPFHPPIELVEPTTDGATVNAEQATASEQST